MEAPSGRPWEPFPQDSPGISLGAIHSGLSWSNRNGFEKLAGSRLRRGVTEGLVQGATPTKRYTASLLAH